MQADETSGGFEWTESDEELFRFVTDEIREVGVHLLPAWPGALNPPRALK